MKPETITSLDIRKLKFLDNIKVDLDQYWMVWNVIIFIGIRKNAGIF